MITISFAKMLDGRRMQQMAKKTKKGDGEVSFKVKVDNKVTAKCSLISLKKKGIYWTAKVRCSNGKIKKATSANKNQAKALACLKC